MKDNHPFFCYKKNCHKTAWDTPEYLSKEDWDDLEHIINLIEESAYYRFFRFVTGKKDPALNFFNYVIGWPEGFSYCHNIEYCEKTAIPSLKQHYLSKMVSALDYYKKNLNGKQ